MTLLWRCIARQELPARLRIFFLSMDTQPAVPLLAERVRNAFDGFGDDMLRLSGIGEFATAWPLFGQVTPPANYAAALQLVAKSRLAVPAAQSLARRR